MYKWRQIAIYPAFPVQTTFQINQLNFFQINHFIKLIYFIKLLLILSIYY